MPVGGWYAASKFAIEALSDAMRWELKDFGIKVVIKLNPVPSNRIRKNRKTEGSKS